MTTREELVALAEEQRIDQLRLAAFKTNSGQDRQTYFDAVSKWFQDRHYRRLDRQEVSVEELARLIEGPLLRRSFENRVEGYTLETSIEQARALRAEYSITKREG